MSSWHDRTGFFLMTREQMKDADKDAREGHKEFDDLEDWTNYGIISIDYMGNEPYKKMYEWCNDNFVGRFKTRVINKPGLVDVHIEKIEDALMFKMRW